MNEAFMDHKPFTEDETSTNGISSGIGSQTGQAGHRAGETAPLNAMAVASLICGILAIPLGLFFSGLAITFALLSRGGKRMNGIATAGLCCALAGLISFALGFIILSIYAGLAGISLDYESLEYGILPFLLSAGQALFGHAAGLALPY